VLVLLVDEDLAPAGHLSLAGRHAAGVITGVGDLVADVGRAGVVVVAAPRRADAGGSRTCAVVVDGAVQPVVAGGGVRLELVRWTRGAGAGALLLYVALSHRGPADGVRRLERVSRTVRTCAGAVLGRVAVTHGGATFEAAR